MSEITPIRLSTELNSKINSAIQDSFGAITFWVIADITNHTFKAQKNYHNFDLKLKRIQIQMTLLQKYPRE